MRENFKLYQCDTNNDLIIFCHETEEIFDQKVMLLIHSFVQALSLLIFKSKTLKSQNLGVKQNRRDQLL